MLAAAGELDERGEGAAARRVDGGVNAAGRELAESLGQPLAVRGRLGAQRAQVLVVAGARRPITRAPRATAIWMAALPTAPAAPLITTVLPAPTPTRSRVRTAVSTATGSPAAPVKSSDGGIGA